MQIERPTIGLALGAGGARGLAHIGILKVLGDNKIPIDYIAGSSIGALIGSLYCAGHSPEQIHKFILHFPQKYWLDYTLPKMGLIEGNKIKEVIRLLTKQKSIEELKIPLSIVATNLNKGERKVFRQGPVAEAVRASISIPGIFIPEKIGKEYYIDGGVIDRVPVSVVKDMGADIIIAVDVSSHASYYSISSIFDVIIHSIDIMEREILNQKIIDADLLLRPKVGHYNTTMFSKIDEIILAGEYHTQQMLGKLKQLIHNWKGKKPHETNSS